MPGCITQPLDPIYFIQGRLSPHSRYIMQHSSVFSSSPRQIDPSSFFRLLLSFFPRGPGGGVHLQILLRAREKEM